MPLTNQPQRRPPIPRYYTADLPTSSRPASSPLILSFPLIVGGLPCAIFLSHLAIAQGEGDKRLDARILIAIFDGLGALDTKGCDSDLFGAGAHSLDLDAISKVRY
jgi:hypothetical protein